VTCAREVQSVKKERGKREGETNEIRDEIPQRVDTETVQPRFQKLSELKLSSLENAREPVLFPAGVLDESDRLDKLVEDFHAGVAGGEHGAVDLRRREEGEEQARTWTGRKAHLDSPLRQELIDGNRKSHNGESGDGTPAEELVEEGNGDDKLERSANDAGERHDLLGNSARTGWCEFEGKRQGGENETYLLQSPPIRLMVRPTLLVPRASASKFFFFPPFAGVLSFFPPSGAFCSSSGFAKTMPLTSRRLSAYEKRTGVSERGERQKEEGGKRTLR
jgi:hypothetical protein